MPVSTISVMNSTKIQIKHISRAPNANSWNVRILRAGRQRSKLDLSHGFADRQYGGHDQALRAAMTWRDQMLQLLNQ